MFPETCVARVCSPNVSQFCRTGKIVSNVNFCFQQTKYVFATRQKHSVFPRGTEPSATFVRQHLDSYAAVSSADNSPTIVRNAPLSFLLLSHNLPGPVFRFFCFYSSTGLQSQQSQHWLQHRPCCDRQVCKKNVAGQSRPNSPRSGPIWKCAFTRGVSRNMFPRLAISVSYIFSRVSYQFCHPVNIYGNMFPLYARPLKSSLYFHDSLFFF